MIEYSLTASDVLAFARYRVKHSPALHQSVLKRRWGYSIGFSLIGLGLWQLTGNFVFFLLFLILSAILFLLFPLYYDWRIRLGVMKALEDDKKGATLGPRKLRASIDNLEMGSGFGEVKLRWETVDKIVEEPGYAYIIVQQEPSILIPITRVGKDEYSAFLAAFREYKTNPSD